VSLFTRRSRRLPQDVRPDDTAALISDDAVSTLPPEQPEQPEPDVTDEPDEPDEPAPITAIDPGEVTQELANRLAALDRAEMVASGRNLAVVGPGALLTKLQTLSAVVWVTGPLARPTGWATLTTPAEGAVLHGTVAAAERGHGLGERLLEHAIAYATEAGYTTLTATIWVETPAEAFARAHAFVPGAQPATVRRQDLYATAARRSRIEDDVSGYGAAYELTSSDEELEQGGGRVYRVAARHAVTGAAAGCAELTVTEGAPEYALNATLQVEPEHRGTRLGTLMSLELISYVQTKASKVRIVQVSSPASDPYVTTIVDRLGFRVAGTQLEHRLALG
jgi:GNAT superfamily N-acetyltransferase